jgi:hypothetical protein
VYSTNDKNGFDLYLYPFISSSFFIHSLWHPVCALDEVTDLVHTIEKASVLIGVSFFKGWVGEGKVIENT